MDQLSPITTDAEPLTPPPVIPPLPTLSGSGGGPAAAMIQQEWVGDRRTFPIVPKPGRQKMSDQLSEFRTGHIILDPEGLTISGKAVLPASMQTPLLVVLLVLFRLGALIAYVILEYAVRRDRTERLTWNEVDAVLTDTTQSRVCIIYHLPAKPKTRYAFGLKMDGGYMEEFVRCIRPHIPERIIEGKIGPATPLAVWIILGVFFLALIGFVVWSTLKP